MFKLKLNFTYLFVAILLFASLPSFSQRDILRQGGSRIRQMGSSFNSAGGGTDSLKRRDKNEDSIPISSRSLDSPRPFKFDSAINVFPKRWPIPATFITLGNTGTASRSLLFSPNMEAGFDARFPPLAIYTFTTPPPP